MHLRHGQDLSQAVVQLAGEFAAFFVLKLQDAAAQAARIDLHALALCEFTFQQAKMNPEQEYRQREHADQNSQSSEEKIAGDFAALREQAALGLHHLVHHVREVGSS